MNIMVRQCQRCGQDHEMDFAPLANPVDEYAWWGMCPVIEQPVLLAIVPVHQGESAP